jgi:hypothetical protein
MLDNQENAMAKEDEKPKKDEGGKGKKKAKLHLYQIRTVEVDDGSHIHHHTYKAKKGDAFTMPERENVATSQSPEEAGQHIEESFAQNGGGQGEAEEPEEAAQGAEPMPGAGAAQAGA